MVLIRINSPEEWDCIILRREIWFKADVCAFSFRATSRVGFAPAVRRYLKRATRKLRISAWRHTARSYFNWRTPILRRTVSAISSFAPWELSARRWRSPYVWPVCPLCLSWCSFLVSEKVRIEYRLNFDPNFCPMDLRPDIIS